MQFFCPYCQNSINAKPAKPGRYKPKCPKCEKVFQLTVPADPAATPVTEAVPEAQPLDPQKTVPMRKSPAKTEPKKEERAKPEPKLAPGPAQTGDVAEATGVFDPNSERAPAEHAAAEATGVVAPSDEPNTRPKAPAKPANPDATGVFTEALPAPVAPDSTGVFGTAPEESANTAMEKPPTQAGRRPQTGDDDFDVQMPSNINVEGPADVPEHLGGYKIVRELGRGGMGAVYLANQTSLDRPVALKVMNPNWGADAGFVARFTREAYAAAQLTHHNIVQIYDFGSLKDLHFFSMEFVDGRSLGDMLKKGGKMDVEQAVGFTLQAARGLKFAHDRGLIHRDVKPDNLMLNTQGIVKVADLGLVKTPGHDETTKVEGEQTMAEPAAKRPLSKLVESASANVTRVGVAMGTPAYMAPEQAKDAAHVDQRADVYSLGCTLYAMVTGKPPFSGKTVMELFSKHASEPIVPPDVIIKRVPKEVSTIIQKMVAKKPGERYQDMEEVAQVLEQWLGIHSPTNPQTFTEDQVTQLEECVNKFNASKLAKIRTGIKVALFGGSILLALILLLLLAKLKLGLAALFLTVEIPFIYLLVSVYFSPSALAVKFREMLMESGWKERIQIVVGLLLLIAIIFAVGLLWHFLGATVLAALLAFGMYFGLDLSVESARQPAVDDAEALFKKLRLKGMDEEALRQFVCKYSGKQWEEFYEALFGYEEKLKARDWWVRGQKGQARQKAGAWREPIITWLETRRKARQAARDKGNLQKVEQNRFQAEGLDQGAARLKAERAAGLMVQKAAEFREADKELAADRAQGELRRPTPIAKVLLEEIDKEEAPEEPVNAMEMIGRIINFALGPSIRFLLGALLLAGCLMWMYQNDLVTKAQNIQGVGHSDDPAAPGAMDVLFPKVSKTLEFGFVPSLLTKPFVGFATGLAGMLLLLSAFFQSWKTAVLMPLAAVLIVFGPGLGIPDVGPLTASQVCMAAGAFLGLVALFLGKGRG